MTAWHSQSIDQVFKALNSNEEGLSAKTVLSLRDKLGFNEITDTGGVKWYQILLQQFANIMMLILFVAMGVSFAVGEHIDAIAIAVIIVLNAIIGFIQEYKAERAIKALKSMAAPHALVMRNGETMQIPARELVPGDIILLEEGMSIPADGRLIQISQMKTVESSLTGESLPIQKSLDLIQKFDSIGDLHNRVFMGTVISQGHGRAVVTEIGMQTEFGKIAHMVQSEENGATPLQKQLNKLSRFLAIMVLFISLGLFLLSFFTGRDPLEMFLLSISLAVSVIPEGLPAVITLTLAMGVQRIAKQNAIIRKLPAAETLGSTSVICTDKTGTLTQNQMTAQVIYVNGEILHIPGVGYSPIGEFPVDLKKNKELSLLLRTGVLCNNSNLIKDKKKWSVVGDPTEGCLLTLGRKGGLDLEKINAQYPRKDELVFDSERKRMSTLNKGVVYSKGAPDAVLEVCSHIQIDGQVLKLTPAKKKEVLKQNDELAAQAFRVLGFAYKEGSLTEEKLIFLGLVGMIDPPREEVKEAIETCRSAHINVIMITGDHALTAQAVGEKIGLYQKGDLVVTGADLEKMTAKQLSASLEKIRIYARVNPHHKVKILKALQRKGHIVAMTGDGVNDAPALKSADIGVAMGITGTDVSKEASEMILTDDNFATIVSTVKSGRVIYTNIKKFVRFLLSANFSEVFVIMIIFGLGYPLPFIPLQILWINLLTDSLPAIALGVDAPEEDIMELKPRNPNRTIWHELLAVSVIAGLISTVISTFLYFSNITDGSIEHTRTVMFTSVVVFEMLLVFSMRFSNKHYFTSFFENKLLLLGVALGIGLQLLAVYHPAFTPILETEPLDLSDWGWILGLCSSGVLIIEIWKFFQPKPTHV